ncbi:hypothetical protein [Bacillus cereus]|uniref:hypothetical protein n=1 Tax=Bacillus cereus TaxID=1396 RepID=UPI00032DB9AC|nr:hypothetical protein [Bacillus cereus]EOO12430.1 hypothetical protein IG9_05532 [Bacillus cereus HuA2-9]
MISVIVNHIKEKSKLLYTIAVIGVIFYFIYSQWSEFKSNWYSLTPIIKIILIHMPSVLLILTFVCATISLFKISNRKSNEKMKDYLKSQKIEVETDKFFRPIGAAVIKEYDFLEGIETETIKIKVINKEENFIEFIDGFISFYYEKERVKVVPVKIKQLYKGYSERVYYNKIDKDTINWDYFDFYITEMKIDDEIYTNVRLRSPSVYKTYYFYLNMDKFIDKKIFGIRTKYNLVWLKEKFRTGFRIVQFFCSPKKYQIKNGRVYTDTWRKVYSLLKNLVVYALFGILILLFLMSLLDIIEMLREIAGIFKMQDGQ